MAKVRSRQELDGPDGGRTNHTGAQVLARTTRYHYNRRAARIILIFAEVVKIPVAGTGGNRGSVSDGTDVPTDEIIAPQPPGSGRSAEADTTTGGQTRVIWSFYNYCYYRGPYSQRMSVPGELRTPSHAAGSIATFNGKPGGKLHRVRSDDGGGGGKDER